MYLMQQVNWPSGKGLGGSSLLNGMMYVRGLKKNYDDWARQGAVGWSALDVWPYFLKLEDNQDQDYLDDGKIYTFEILRFFLTECKISK